MLTDASRAKRSVKDCADEHHCASTEETRSAFIFPISRRGECHSPCREF